MVETDGGNNGPRARASQLFAEHASRAEALSKGSEDDDEIISRFGFIMQWT